MCNYAIATGDLNGRGHKQSRILDKWQQTGIFRLIFSLLLCHKYDLDTRETVSCEIIIFRVPLIFVDFMVYLTTANIHVNEIKYSQCTCTHKTKNPRNQEPTNVKFLRKSQNFLPMKIIDFTVLWITYVILFFNIVYLRCSNLNLTIPYFYILKFIFQDLIYVMHDCFDRAISVLCSLLQVTTRFIFFAETWNQHSIEWHHKTHDPWSGLRRLLSTVTVGGCQDPCPYTWLFYAVCAGKWMSNWIIFDRSCW